MHFQALLAIAPLFLGTTFAFPTSSRPGAEISKRELVFLTDIKGLECSPTQKYRIRKVLENVEALTVTALTMKRNSPAYKVYFDNDGENGKLAIFNNVKGRFQKIHQFVEASIESLDPANTPTTKYETVQILCPKDENIGHCTEAIATASDATKDDPAQIIFCPSFWKLVPGTPKLDTKFTHEFADGVREFDICKQPNKMGYTNPPEVTILHELTHLTSLSNGRSRTIDCVYGAYWPTYVAAIAPKVAERNAENYPYMALSMYFGEMCEKQDVTFWQEGPTPGQPAKNQPMGIEKGYYDQCKLPSPASDVLPMPQN